MTLVLLILCGAARGQTLEQLVERHLPDLVTSYKHLHSHPELSYQEKETAAYLAGKLRGLGFEVTEGVGRYNTPNRTSHGFVAVMKNGAGPTVMVRTDLDGLPVVENTGAPYASRATTQNDAGEQVGVMHACGHDVHMTTFLGAAQILAGAKDRWKGTLVMIGQPAEELGTGARALLKDGLYSRFPKPDFALTVHAEATLEAGKIGICPEFALAAVDSVDILVRGKGGHGAYPHTTTDPIVLASQIVLGLQTIVSRQVSPLDSAVVTVGSIHGGTKRNIIPDEVHLQLTVRSYKPEVRQMVLNSIRRISQGIAMAAGLPADRLPTVTVDPEEFAPATYNDPELANRMLRLLKSKLGEDRVTVIDPVMGGEDFGHYSLESREIPTLLMWVGTVDPARLKAGTPLPSLHSSQFLPLPEPTLRGGVTAMTAAVLELMQ